jgi:hypothetical protein
MSTEDLLILQGKTKGGGRRKHVQPLLPMYEKRTQEKQAARP